MELKTRDKTLEEVIKDDGQNWFKIGSAHTSTDTIYLHDKPWNANPPIVAWGRQKGIRGVQKKYFYAIEMAREWCNKRLMRSEV